MRLVAGIMQPVTLPHEQGLRVVGGGWSHRQVGQRLRVARRIVVAGTEGACSHQHPDREVRRAEVLPQHESGGGRAVEVGIDRHMLVVCPEDREPGRVQCIFQQRPGHEAVAQAQAGVPRFQQVGVHIAPGVAGEAAATRVRLGGFHSTQDLVEFAGLQTPGLHPPPRGQPGERGVPVSGGDQVGHPPVWLLHVHPDETDPPILGLGQSPVPQPGQGGQNLARLPGPEALGTQGGCQVAVPTQRRVQQSARGEAALPGQHTQPPGLRQREQNFALPAEGLGGAMGGFPQAQHLHALQPGQQEGGVRDHRFRP